MATETEERADLEAWLVVRVPCWRDDNDAEWRMTLACVRRRSISLCSECHDAVVNHDVGVLDSCHPHEHRWSDTPRRIEFHRL